MQRQIRCLFLCNPYVWSCNRYNSIWRFSKWKNVTFSINNKVVSKDYRPRFKVPVKDSIRSLIEQCWSKDPKLQPTFEEIFNRLAFNVEESVYDVFQNGQETPKYYLDDVDQNELMFYVDGINVETTVGHSCSTQNEKFCSWK